MDIISFIPTNDERGDKSEKILLSKKHTLCHLRLAHASQFFISSVSPRQKFISITENEQTCTSYITWRFEKSGSLKLDLEFVPYDSFDGAREASMLI